MSESTVGGALTEADQQVIRATIEEWTQALRDGAWDRWIAYYEEDAELLVPGESRLAGREAILGYVKPRFGTLTGFRFERWQIIGLGDLAVVDNDIIISESDGDETAAKQIIVLRRDGEGRWRMHWVAYSTPA